LDFSRKVTFGFAWTSICALLSRSVPYLSELHIMNSGLSWPTPYEH
jgi:hypothetical protein